MSDIRIQPQPVAIARVIFLFIIAITIVLILAWLLTGGGGEFFESKTSLHSFMPDASGLIVTAAVQLNGIQIGKVSGITLSGSNDPKKVVRVEMKVKTRYLPAIPVDSTVSITADNLLGDKYLNILSGKRAETVRPDAELRSLLPIADQFNSADLVAAMKDMLNRIDASLKQIEDPATPVGNFVQTDDVYRKIEAEFASLQEAIQKFAHPQSQFGQMLFTDESYEQFRAPLVAIDRTLTDLQAGEGEFGHIIATSEQYDRVRRDLADLRQSLARINAGKGPVGEFVKTDAAYRQMERLANTIERMVDGISSGDSRLSAWLADSQLYESLTGSTGELQREIGDFRRNPHKYLRLKVF